MQYSPDSLSWDSSVEPCPDSVVEVLDLAGTGRGQQEGQGGGDGRQVRNEGGWREGGELSEQKESL